VTTLIAITLAHARAEVVVASCHPTKYLLSCAFRRLEHDALRRGNPPVRQWHGRCTRDVSHGQRVFGPVAEYERLGVF